MLAKKIIKYINCSLKSHKELSQFTIDILTQTKKYLKKYKGHISFEHMRGVLADIISDCGNKEVPLLERVIVYGILCEVLWEESILKYDTMEKH